jgi:hypothetical protein
LGLVLCFLLLLGMYGLCNCVVVVEWEFIAYMLLVLYLPSVCSSVQCEASCRVSGTHGSMCLGELPFADQNLDHGFALMIDSPRAMHLCYHCRCCIISQDSCCLFTVLFGRRISPWSRF